jgi:hypothetical protein
VYSTIAATLFLEKGLYYYANKLVPRHVFLEWFLSCAYIYIDIAVFTPTPLRIAEAFNRVIEWLFDRSSKTSTATPISEENHFEQNCIVFLHSTISATIP